MKKYSKDFFKKILNKVLVITVFSIVGIIIASLSFGSDYVEAMSKAEHINSIYEDTTYDYLLRGVSEEQIIDIKNHESVKSVFKYNITGSDISLSNKNEINIEILSLYDDENIVDTEFSPQRIIKSIASKEHEIYIGNDLVKKYNVKLGETISILGLNFEVTRIYDYTNLNKVYIPNFKSITESLGYNLLFTSVYVVTNDIEIFENNFLNPYVPRASQKKLDEFESLEDYNNYLADYNSKDYSSYFDYKFDNYETDKDQIKSLISTSKNKVLLKSVIFGIVLFIGIIGYNLLKTKVIKKEIIDSGRKELKQREVISAIIIVVLSYMFWIINLFILSKTSSEFIKVTKLISDSIYSFFVTIAFVLVGTLINIVIINKKKNIKNEKHKLHSKKH